ncbi:MAG: hypothetical protein Q8R18_01400 [bacterium]|nr:hypothetical protein [bacterium]
MVAPTNRSEIRNNSREKYQQALAVYRQQVQIYREDVKRWRQEVQRNIKDGKIVAFPTQPKFPRFPQLSESLENVFCEENNFLDTPLGKPLEHQVSNGEVTYNVHSLDQLFQAIQQGLLLYENKKITARAEEKRGKITLRYTMSIRSY